VALYSTLFYAGVVTTATPAALYTVPADYVVVVRDIVTRLSSGSADTITVYDGTNLVTLLVATPATTAATSIWQGRQVFTAGQVIAAAVTGGTWQLRISGYLLTV
jgi:hypothetical protein